METLIFAIKLTASLLSVEYEDSWFCYDHILCAEIFSSFGKLPTDKVQFFKIYSVLFVALTPLVTS